MKKRAGVVAWNLFMFFMSWRLFSYDMFQILQTVLVTFLLMCGSAPLRYVKYKELWRYHLQNERETNEKLSLPALHLVTSENIFQAKLHTPLPILAIRHILGKGSGGAKREPPIRQEFHAHPSSPLAHTHTPQP